MYIFKVFRDLLFILWNDDVNAFFFYCNSKLNEVCLDAILLSNKSALMARVKVNLCYRKNLLIARSTEDLSSVTLIPLSTLNDWLM